LAIRHVTFSYNYVTSSYLFINKQAHRDIRVIEADSILGLED
jgi:hypothetical protein